jgi:heat-inducible transcriptional repressor
MELDLRKQRILNAIVQDYIVTAEPVGSHLLVERYQLGVKSATVRNEMAEMSERGYLRQPHTSAGRIPSDLGYRFYVNRLMALPVIQASEVVRIQSAIHAVSSELDAVLRRTCQLLAEMTRLPAVATPPSAEETELRQVFLSPAGVDKALLLLLFSTGHTEHRILLDTRLSASDALVLANALNERLSGSSLNALLDLADADDEPPAELRGMTTLWRRAISEAVSAARGLGEDTSVVVEGTQAAFDQPEFRDVDRLSGFLTLLQERAAVLDTLRTALNEAVSVAPQPGVRVVIGEEMGRPGLSEYSVVSSRYYIGNRERGSIGVFGPTRMDYARVSAAVELMARTMSDILTRLSVAD